MLMMTSGVAVQQLNHWQSLTQREKVTLQTEKYWWPHASLSSSLTTVRLSRNAKSHVQRQVSLSSSLTIACLSRKARLTASISFFVAVFFFVRFCVNRL